MFGEKINPLDHARLEAKADLLQDENERLRKQVDYLQQALVSSIAPDAYSDMKAEQAAAEDDAPSQEAWRKYDNEMKLLGEYGASIEQPFFSDPDDMIDKLTQMAGGIQVADKSIHDNEES